MRVRLGLALVAAAVAGSSSASASQAALAAAATPGSHAVTITWTATQAGRVEIELGRDRRYGIWLRVPKRAQQTGRSLIGSLEPSTTYRYRVTLRSGGRTARTEGTFTTAPFPAWTTGAVIDKTLLVDWQPFFPRMVYAQCDWAYQYSLAAGVNFYMGTGCGSPWNQLELLRARAVSALPAAHKDIADGRGTIGWYHPDEADLYMPPEALPFHPPWQRTWRVTFLTLSGHVYSGSAPPPGGRSVYPRFVARADMLGLDLYPLQVWCRRDALGAVYEAQRELAALAAPRGTYQWIEAGRMEFCGGRPELDPTPATVRAETWLAIAGGARGIGWFPDHWQPAIADEVTRLSTEISALAPALLAAEVPVLTTRTSAVKAGGRWLNDVTYVIAVNSSLRTVNAEIEVPGLRATSAGVFGEARRVAVRTGRIVDRFGPLAVRVYTVRAG